MRNRVSYSVVEPAGYSTVSSQLSRSSLGQRNCHLVLRIVCASSVHYLELAVNKAAQAKLSETMDHAGCIYAFSFTCEAKSHCKKEDYKVK